jgi:serine/threonine protein kinase
VAVLEPLLSEEVEATYELLEKLGEGGMGAAYKVRHRTFGELSVIKVMRASLQNNALLRERFEREAKRGKQLDHPNIAHVLNYFIGANGNPHLVIEYIEGINVSAVLRRTTGPLDLTTATTIGLHTLSALGYLHAHRIIHRDISPDNLMLTERAPGDITVKLIDLGIAKFLDESHALTDYGGFIGKAAYASPEQFGDTVDHRSDMYSTGIVLYELLTKALPITGTNFLSFAAAHQKSAPRPFSESDPTGRVPENLRCVVMKALEKKPARRYQSADEFANALRSTLTPAVMPTIVIPPLQTMPSIDLTLPNPQPPPSPRPARRPIAASVAAILLTVTIGAFVVNQLRPRKPDAVPPPHLSDTAVTDTMSTGLTDTASTATSDAEVTVAAITPEIEDELDDVVRKVLAGGRQPGESDPDIAQFLAAKALTYEKAEPAAQRIASRLRNATYAIDRGKQLTTSGDLQAAYNAFLEAKTLDPKNTFAWTNLGAAAALLNKPSEAMRAYQHALRLDPDNWLAHYNYACQLARSGRKTDALNEISTAVKQLRSENPRNVESILKSMRGDAALGELRNDPSFLNLIASP